MSELLFRAHRVALPEGLRAASVRVRDGRITAVGSIDAPAGAASEIVVEDAVLLPGLVDTHVHMNEPGRTEWEGFRTATRAAAAGGVTTLLDMPLNSIPATTTSSAFEAKLVAARGQCHVDVGFIGGVVPGNETELARLAEQGVMAWKSFLVDSGVPEFAAVSENDLRRVAPMLRELGLPLMVHAESPEALVRAARVGPLRCYEDYMATRPDDGERDAVARMIRLAQEFGVHVHIVHLSTDLALPILREARALGVPITVETCPHYLSFHAQGISDGATEYKCAPPIRSANTREALWNALGEGVIDTIGSDHSPAPPAMKQRERGDFAAAWGGIASLQLGLSAVWRGARERGVPMTRVVDWMATTPARVVRLSHKGAIAEGRDADLVVFEPDTEWTVDGARLEHRHAMTPYHGCRLPGRVRTTYLRGEPVYHDGSFAEPRGRVILRSSA